MCIPLEIWMIQLIKSCLANGENFEFKDYCCPEKLEVEFEQPWEH